MELTTRCIATALPGVVYHIASICPPSAFAAVDPSQTVMWHGGTGDTQADAMMAADAPPVIHGGQTVGLRAIELGWQLGFRRFHLFGFDSSTDIACLHPYESVSDGVEEVRIQLQCLGRLFETTPEFAGQAQEFIPLYQNICARGGEIHVHGDGLLPLIWREIDQGRSAPPRLVLGPDAPLEVHALQF